MGKPIKRGHKTKKLQKRGRAATSRAVYNSYCPRHEAIASLWLVRILLTRKRIYRAMNKRLRPESFHRRMGYKPKETFLECDGEAPMGTPGLLLRVTVEVIGFAGHEMEDYGPWPSTWAATQGLWRNRKFMWIP